MNERALGLLGIAQKGGNIEIGEDPVGNAARAGKARLIILASDAAGHTVRRAGSFASLHETPLVTVEGSKDVLGRIFGRNSVAMIAVTDILLAKRFLETLGDPETYGEALTAVTEKAAVMAQRKKAKPRINRKNGKKQ